MNWHSRIANQFYSSSKHDKRDTSVFSMIGMGVGCFAMIIALSVMNGFEFLVHQKLKGFEGDLTMYGDFSDNIVGSFEGVDFVMPFMERKGIIKANNANKIVTMKAVDQIIMEKFYDLSIRGEMPKNGQVIIGQDLANHLGKDLNDKIVLYSPIDQVYGFGIPPMKELTISGIFSTKILNYDDSYAFFTLADGKILFKRKDSYDGFDLRISEDKNIEDIRLNLMNIFKNDIQFYSWEEKNRSLVDAMKMERIGAIVILGLIFLVSSFNLASSLILISIRKMKEVGIIRAMGASQYSVMKIMIQLGIKKSLKGAVIGFSLAILLVLIQNTFFLIPLPSNIYFIDSLPMRLTGIDIGLVIIIASIFIISASYFSARKIVYLKLPEVLQWIK